MALPAMVWDKRTKINNEINVYYNLGVGKVEKYKNFIAGTGVVDSTPPQCGSDDVCPGGSFQATVVPFSNGGAVGTIPIKSPIWTAKEGEHAPSAEGDAAWVVCLPDPANDVHICYDQGVVPALGETFRPVPVKFNLADHYVPQRPENTITLNDLFVSNWRGVQAIRGVRCTIIVKVSPKGSGVYSEIQYYSNVILNVPPINSAADGNANVEISGEGAFSFAAIFAAEPP